MTATRGAVGTTRAHVALAAFTLASLVAFVTVMTAMLTRSGALPSGASGLSRRSSEILPVLGSISRT